MLWLIPLLAILFLFVLVPVLVLTFTFLSILLSPIVKWSITIIVIYYFANKAGLLRRLRGMFG